MNYLLLNVIINLLQILIFLKFDLLNHIIKEFTCIGLDNNFMPHNWIIYIYFSVKELIKLEKEMGNMLILDFSSGRRVELKALPTKRHKFIRFLYYTQQHYLSPPYRLS